MKLPPCFLPQPPADWSADVTDTFERLFREAVDPGIGGTIDYNLSAPKWQFLCHLADRKDILLHGSGRPDIKVFEPRQSNDVNAFGNRRAVYAASDAIWAIYFAVVNRERVKSLVNGAFRIVEPHGLGEPRYFFSIDADPRAQESWRSGSIYLLPGRAFERQPREASRGFEVETAQWASLVPVQPLARLPVEPDDFPFIRDVQRHDPATVRDRAMAEPDGFPWLDP